MSRCMSKIKSQWIATIQHIVTINIFFTLSNKAASIRSLVYSKLIRRIRHMNMIKEETLMKLYTSTMSPL